MDTGSKFLLVFCVSLFVVIIPEAFIGGGLLQFRVQEAFDTIEEGFPKFYRLDVSNLPSNLQRKFIELNQDEETTYFMRNSSIQANNIARALWQTLVKTALRLFCTKTTIMGFLGHSRMFVFSSNQFETLLNMNDTWKADSLLDIGAGDGAVTSHMSKYFHSVHVTEVSPTMRWRLQEKGFTLTDVDAWHEGRYDVISVLNVLDRCDRPITMLQNIHSALKPDGRLVVAIVLPYKPFVETGTPDHRQIEELPISGKGFIKQLASVVENIFEPAGFEVIAFTKLPYLCEGNLRSPFLKLNDAVFVLKKKDKSKR